MNNYQIINLIKENNTCRVFWARESVDNLKVILKEINPQLVDDSFEHRFSKWAKRLISLDHLNLVNYLDFGCHEGKYIFVVEDTCFTSIYDLFDNELASEEIFCVFSQILKATAYGHSKGVLNGEFDFEHLLYKKNRILIEDFGIKNILYPSLSLMGSKRDIDVYNFYSPEQFTEEQITDKSDIYSLGALLYAMTERALPFSGLSGYENLKQAVVKTEFLEASKDNIFAPFIRKATMKNPQDRYPSVNQWLHEWEIWGQMFEKKKQDEQGKIIENDVTGEVIAAETGEKSTEEDKEEKFLQELKVKSKRRFTVLVTFLFVILLILAGFFLSDYVSNPIAYNFFTSKYLDRVFLVPRNESIVDIISSSPGEYVFDLQVDEDSGDIRSSNVIDFSSSMLNSVRYVNGDIILVGGNSPTQFLTFPMLVLIRQGSYEPYYNTNENGSYVDVAVSGNNLYLLKFLYGTTASTSKVIVEKRDFNLNLLSSSQIDEDIINDSVIPRAMRLLDSLVIIEGYDYHKQSIVLLAFDGEAKPVWQKQIKSVPVSTGDVWFNLDVKNNLILLSAMTKRRSGRVYTYILDRNGKQKNVLKFKPHAYVQSIDKLGFLGDSSLIISLYTDKRYSLIYIYNLRGDRLLRKHLGYFEKVRITDAKLINEQDVLLAGISRGFFMNDTVKAQNIYLLKMSFPKGKIKPIPFPSQYFVSVNK